jgi:hypothetical protein
MKRERALLVGSLLMGAIVAGCGSSGVVTPNVGAAGGDQLGTPGVAGSGGSHPIDGGGAGSSDDGSGTGSTGGGGSGSASNGGGAGDRDALDGAASMTGSGGAAVEGGATPDVGVSGPPSPWPALAQPAITLQGGSAPSSGGQAQAGGNVHLVSRGAVALDSTLVAPPTPDIPKPPVDAIAVTATALTTDLVTAGSATVDGSILSAGADLVRQITAGGDIFVRGTLRGADLGATRQGLTLKSLAGTIYVTGAVDGSGSSGSGQAGGALTLVAGRVVITGELRSAGGGGATAGKAGPISFMITQGLFLSGTIDASGGDAQGPASSGGPGGALNVQAGGDVVLGGTALVRGGAASSTGSSAQGGAAGVVTINSDGAVTFAGTLDGRGGVARAAVAGGAVTGGAPGALKVGEAAAPTAVAVLVPLLITGGDGVAVGGGGGTALLEPHGGDLRLAGVLDVSGGNSAGKPGSGGNIDGNPGSASPALGTAGVDIAGQVLANGGSITSGGVGDGAAGGLIKLLVQSSDGNMTLEPTGLVQADGGQSGGTGTAGGGGVMYLFTMDGNASLHGRLLARGGAAPDAGGTGGGGGFVYVFTDNNHGGTHGGALIIETDATIDASGGSGTIGGSARSDGRANAVATWPVTQDNEFDVQHVAVLINSDGRHGAATGYIDNRGHIVARGGKANGAGGDVQYHGRRQDGNETPLSGAVDMAGDGTGLPGDYAGE